MTEQLRRRFERMAHHYANQTHMPELGRIPTVEDLQHELELHRNLPGNLPPPNPILPLIIPPPDLKSIQDVINYLVQTLHKNKRDEVHECLRHIRNWLGNNGFADDKLFDLVVDVFDRYLHMSVKEKILSVNTIIKELEKLVKLKNAQDPNTHPMNKAFNTIIDPLMTIEVVLKALYVIKDYIVRVGYQHETVFDFLLYYIDTLGAMSVEDRINNAYTLINEIQTLGI
jgi:hypothetical protein